MTVYPMTFDEFLMNSNKMLYNVLKNAYDNKQPLETHIHQLAIEQVYKYLLVGGMPEAVDAYIDSDNLLESRETITFLTWSCIRRVRSRCCVPEHCFKIFIKN